MNCWAPEIFYDDKTEKFIIFWATSIPGRFPETDATGDPGGGKTYNHRIYCVTTEDFKTYSDTKLFYDDGFSVIDATMVKDGEKYVLIFKDETKLPVAKKNLRMATADAAEGPFGQASQPISPDWVEGPTALKIGERWIVYFDEYTRGRYGAIASADMKKWENISSKAVFPQRHPPWNRAGSAQFGAAKHSIEKFSKLRHAEHGIDSFLSVARRRQSQNARNRKRCD